MSQSITNDISMTDLMPVIYVPHGGGPLPLLGEENHHELINFLKHIAAELPCPKSILVISAHWEERIAHVSAAAAPAMIYDYHGFPSASYQYQYPAPGKLSLADKIVDLLREQNIEAQLDVTRGFDHGTFVPLMLMYPQATVPVVQLSLLTSLDPVAHIALGKAISPLREQGVLIIGSGMSFHNLHEFFSGEPDMTEKSKKFDDWLSETLTDNNLSTHAQQTRLEQWRSAPEALFSHPREEHLLPLHVCFGAASGASTKAEKNFSGILFNTFISGFIWR